MGSGESGHVVPYRGFEFPGGISRGRPRGCVDGRARLDELGPFIQSAEGYRFVGWVTEMLWRLIRPTDIALLVAYASGGTRPRVMDCPIVLAVGGRHVPAGRRLQIPPFMHGPAAKAFTMIRQGLAGNRRRLGIATSSISIRYAVSLGYVKGTNTLTREYI